ncbi:MAG: type IX secretion system sortase PorU [Rhodothermales bacterium]
MSVRFAHIWIILIVIAGASCIRPAWSQDVDVRTADATSDGIVLDVTVDWPASLRAVADSASLSSFTIESARALSFGLPVISETLELPSRHLPRLTVLTSDYEEIDLPEGDTLAANAVAGRMVWVDGLGTSRNRPVVNLVARLLAYEDGSVRRVRRLTVRLSYGSSSTAGALSLSRRIGGSFDADAADNPHLDVGESVLSDGTIYKIPVSATGIYRIDRAFLAALPGLGMAPESIDPDHVRIYGNGGAPVPAANAAPRKADLVENPAYRIGGGDGAFDVGDAVIFYGAGPRGWAFEDDWNHYVHPYSNENYYFVKIADGEGGASVGSPSVPDYAAPEVIEEVDGRYVAEFDEFMWSKENGTGHTWVSNTIRAGESRQLLDDLTLPGLTGGPIRLVVRAAIRSNPVAELFFEAGGQSLGSLRAPRSVTSSETSPIASPDTATFTASAPAQPMNVSMRLDEGALNAPEAAVDWIRLFYPRRLVAAGDSLHFASPAGRTGRFEFVLRGFSAQPQVWDVTDHASIRRLGVRADGATYRVRLEVTDAARPRELVAFLPTNARTLQASRAQAVANQNLHAPGAFPEFIIVVPEAFRAAADELARYRRDDGLDVLVAEIDEIYNEFSGGLMDVRGVRDFLRFHYDRGADVGLPLRYALLFGDGHFNYRNLGSETQQAELTNWIPPYETEESFDPNESYTSDDYFALLDADEGIWEWPGRYDAVGSERMDIGIGRLPVQTSEEAAAMVEKIKHYENPSSYGSWRTRYLFLADDGYNGIRPQQEPQPDLHTQNADVVASVMDEDFPWIDVKKIYGISYTREFLNGWRLPGAKRDLLSTLSDGVLVMNYSGHGGEYSLAQEELFTREDALAMRNYDRMPIFITATCSFGWWDLASEQSAAEALLLNEAGGSIALLTTVRLVYTSSGINTLNVGLNRALTAEMFQQDEDGGPRRLGDILLSTKNTFAGLQGNNRKFNLLGDPTLRIGTPEQKTVIETINGTPLEETPSLRALDEVSVEGTVRTRSGETDVAFDGQADLTIFDAERRVEISNRVAMPRDYYTVREDLIWRGVVPVSGGRFEATFVVPKDISYSNEAGRISAYARNPKTHASGYTESFIVGGTAANPPDDAKGPEIDLFLNDTTFVSGGLTPQHPNLIVRLHDDSGINTVGAGVGHEMLLVVDGEEQHAVDISGRFQSDPNSYRSGRVTYPFEEYSIELEDGPHTLSVRAWDVLNNSSTEVLDFFVSSSRDVVLQNVYNYPNPTRGQTRFIFEHNQPTGTPADVQIRVYTLSGRPIRTIDPDEALPSGVLTGGPVQVPWDGRDEDLNPLASGVYLYKVRVATEGLDGERYVSERIEKLAIIR